METKPHVVIIGGGFAGLACAQSLKRAPVEVTVVDRRNHHLFQPLLYQVATAALNPGDIAYPIRAALRRQKNAKVLLAEVTEIDRGNRRIKLGDSEITYDYLVVAAGAKHSYFGNKAWEQHAPGLKTVEDALEIRRRVLMAYENAEVLVDDVEARKAWLTFAVVGGGPTGVELAGALAEIGRYTLAKDFRTIDPRSVRVVLFEAGGRLLPGFPDKCAANAESQLKKLGVEVRKNCRVSDLDEGSLIADGDRLETRTVLWAAGVEASPLAKALNCSLTKAGQVVVDEYLRVPDTPCLWVVGDMAHMEDENGTVPALAPAASQAGRYVGKNIRRHLRGKTPEPFRYVDKGALATVGRSRAVGHFREKITFSGLFAWMVWWFVHIFFLVGFRSRIAVMFGWIWNYLTFQRGARLITGRWDPENKSLERVLPGSESSKDLGRVG